MLKIVLKIVLKTVLRESAKLRSMSSWLGELGELDELENAAQCPALSELARSPRRPGVGHDGVADARAAKAVAVPLSRRRRERCGKTL